MLRVVLLVLCSCFKSNLGKLVCFFQLLQQCTDPITEDEEEALTINRGRQDKNRPGADIPGNGTPCVILVTMR